ncbi:hypothetical protein C8R45DRAFT_1018058 [Mycena sanguinolenta]|nr:hypothetical protein C8R45DRAFT_1018058 [Mycena sanguinolenta]
MENGDWRAHLNTSTADFLDALYAEDAAEQAGLAKKPRGKGRRPKSGGETPLANTMPPILGGADRDSNNGRVEYGTEGSLVQSCANCHSTTTTSTYWANSPSGNGQKMCFACYQYELKRGKTRPVHLEARRQMRLFPTCKDCDGTILNGRGHYSKRQNEWKICGACYRYEKKHNELRSGDISSS